MGKVINRTIENSCQVCGKFSIQRYCSDACVNRDTKALARISAMKEKK